MIRLLRQASWVHSGCRVYRIGCSCGKVCTSRVDFPCYGHRRPCHCQFWCVPCKLSPADKTTRTAALPSRRGNVSDISKPRSVTPCRCVTVRPNWLPCYGQVGNFQSRPRVWCRGTIGSSHRGRRAHLLRLWPVTAASRLPLCGIRSA